MSAPLIIDPTAGGLAEELKDVCRKFEEVTDMRVAVQERAGNALKHLAKSEPLKIGGCGRDDTGFAVKPASRQARQADMMERLYATVTPEGSNMLLPSGWKMKRMHSGSTVW